jgi:hypothetical protein
MLHSPDLIRYLHPRIHHRNLRLTTILIDTFFLYKINIPMLKTPYILANLLSLEAILIPIIMKRIYYIQKVNFRITV